MSTVSEIPLFSAPQKLAIALGGIPYSLTVKWNDTVYGGGLAEPCWILDIADANEVPIITGIPLVTGADLLAQYKYLGIKGQLIVQTDNDSNAVPTASNLGTEGHLYFRVP